MDEIDEIKQRINLLSYIQSVYDLGKQTKSSGGYLFKNCPMCNSNSSKSGDAGHFFVNESTNSYSSFSGCCKGGSIIDFIMEYYNLDTKEAIQKAKEIAGIRSGDVKNMYNNKPQQQNNNKQQQTQEEKQKAEFIRNQKRQFILDNLAHQSPENKQKVYEYLESRGISKEIGDKYHLFISNEVYEDKSTGTEGTSRIVIPIYYDKEPMSYVARALTNVEGRAKALNSAGSQIPLNIDYLFKEAKAEEDKCIYVCEGRAIRPTTAGRFPEWFPRPIPFARGSPGRRAHLPTSVGTAACNPARVGCAAGTGSDRSDRMIPAHVRAVPTPTNAPSTLPDASDCRPSLRPHAAARLSFPSGDCEPYDTAVRKHSRTSCVPVLCDR